MFREITKPFLLKESMHFADNTEHMNHSINICISLEYNFSNNLGTKSICFTASQCVTVGWAFYIEIKDHSAKKMNE